jgi:hypothetical protein
MFLRLKRCHRCDPIACRSGIHFLTGIACHASCRNTEGVAEIEATMSEIQGAIEAAVAVSSYLSAAPTAQSGDISTPVHPSLR